MPNGDIISLSASTEATRFIAGVQSTGSGNIVDRLTTAVSGIHSFDRLKSLSLSALETRDGEGQNLVAYLAQIAIIQANMATEVGEFRKLIDSGEASCLEQLVYRKLEGKTTEPSEIAKAFENVASRTLTKNRLLTVEKGPRQGKHNHYLMEFDLFDTPFITRSFPDGISMKAIIQGKSPSAILALATDLSAKRTYDGSFGFDNDKFTSILEYAFCEIMTLYLIPFSQIGERQQVRDLLAHNTNALELYDSIIDFQDLIIQKMKSGENKEVISLISMLRKRQIYDISTLVKFTVSRDDDRPLFINVLSQFLKVSNTMKSGARERMNTLIELLRDSSFGINYLFFSRHQQYKLTSTELQGLEMLTPKSGSIKNEALRVAIGRKPVEVEHLDQLSLFAAELGIDSITFTLGKGNAAGIIARVRSKDGIAVPINLEVVKPDEIIELRVLRLYLKFILSSIDIQKRKLASEKLLAPSSVEKFPCTMQGIDMVDSQTAEVSTVEICDYEREHARCAISGPIGETERTLYYYSTPDTRATDVAKTFEAKLLGQLFPPEKTLIEQLDQIQNAPVRLGDSANTVAEKLEKRKAGGSRPTAHTEGALRIKSFNSLAKEFGLDVPNEE